MENESDYYPWGGEQVITSTLANQNYKFTGKERDSESGLDFFGARFYANQMGRWMSPDWSEELEPVPYADLTDPQTLNLYGYVRNNPMSHSDPDGHQGPWSQILSNPEVQQAVEDLGPLIKNAAGIAIGAAAAAWANSKAYLDQAADVISSTGLPSNAAGPDPGVVPSSNPDWVLTRNANKTNAQTDKNSPNNPPVGPVKPENAPGVTAGGQATNKHGQKLGPSGKPQVNNVNKNTREAANNAANKGSGTMEHRNPRRGKPHFHTKRGNGTKKQDGTHYNYPK
jgi:RHS repeat-associated protein